MIIGLISSSEGEWSEWKDFHKEKKAFNDILQVTHCVCGW